MLKISALLVFSLLSQTSESQIVNSSSSSGSVISSSSVSYPNDQIPAFVVPDENTSVDVLSSIVKLFIKAVEDKDWAKVAAFALMLVVFAFKKWVLPKLSDEPEKFHNWMPIIAIVMASIPGLITTLMAKNVTGMSIISSIISITLMSIGTWEFVVMATKSKNYSVGNSIQQTKIEPIVSEKKE